MTVRYDEFRSIVQESACPVILLEGTRELPDADRPLLVALGAKLAGDFAGAVFRTGNAPGSDEAFAAGVSSVDPARLQLVLPYQRHRQRSGDRGSYRIGLDALPRAAEERAVYETSRASPGYGSLLQKRELVPKLKAKSGYLIRDTLKVIGASEAGLAPATIGVFRVHEGYPMRGGTGHTIRVCRAHGVPVVFQDAWVRWLVTQGNCRL